MAIWDSSSVTTVGTAISPLIQDTPNLAKNAIIKAIFNDLPIAETIVSTMLAGYSIKPFSYYREGSSGRYPLGLPTGGTGDAPNVQTAAAQDIIAGIEGLTVPEITFEEIAFRSIYTPTPTEVGYIIALNEYGLDKITGELNNSGYTPTAGYVVGIRFHRLVPVRKSAINYRVVTYLHEYDPNNKEATLTNLDVSTNLDTELVDNPYPGIVKWKTEGTVVRYTIPDGSGGQSEPITFFYNETTANGLYPSLEPDNLAEINSPYFPVAPIRIDKQMVGDPGHQQPFYREEMGDAVRKLLRFVNIDLEQMQDAIATNPDVALIDDSYIMFAIPIGIRHQPLTLSNTGSGEFNLQISKYEETQPVLKYLYRYIEYLINDIQTSDKAAFTAKFDEYSPNPIPRNELPFNVLDISDSELQQAVYWNYAEIIEITYIPPSTYNFFNTIDGIPVFGSRDASGNSYEFAPTVNGADLSIKDRGYSLSSINVYRHDDINQKSYLARLSGLYVQNDIITDKVVIATIYEAFFSPALGQEPTPEDGTDPIKDGLYLPIAYNVLRTLSIKEQGEVTFRGLILLNYAIQVQRVEFYERPAFANLIRIGLIVLAVTGNPQFLLAEVGFQEIAYIILEQILIGELTSQLLNLIFPFVVDIIGVDAATILAVVAIAAGIAKSFEINIGTFFPDAATLIQLSSALSNAIGEQNIEDLLKIEQEANNTAKLIEEAQDLVDKVLDSGIDINVNVYSLIDTSLRVEYPSDFYARTLNPNIGLLTLDVIESFYSNALNTDLI